MASHFDDIHEFGDYLNSLLDSKGIKFVLTDANPDSANKLWRKAGVEGAIYYSPPADQQLLVKDKKRIQPGRIEIMVNPQFLKKIANAEDVDQMVQIVTAVIRHELVHREQNRRAMRASGGSRFGTPRYGKIKDRVAQFQRYVNDPHEMMAMVGEILDEFKILGVSIPELITALKTYDMDVLASAPRMRDYIAYNYNNPNAMKRVYKTLFQVIDRRSQPLKTK